MALLGVRSVELDSSYVCVDGVVYDRVREQANGTVVLENNSGHGKGILDDNLEHPSIDRESAEAIRKELAWKLVEKMTEQLGMGNLEPDFTNEFRRKVFALVDSL